VASIYRAAGLRGDLFSGMAARKAFLRSRVSRHPFYMTAGGSVKGCYDRQQNTGRSLIRLPFGLWTAIVARI